MSENRGKNTNNTLAELKAIWKDIEAGRFSSDGYRNAVADIKEDIAQLEDTLKQVVNANVAYKYVPAIKCKVQPVTILSISDGIYTGKLSNGRVVYFKKEDIQ